MQSLCALYITMLMTAASSADNMSELKTAWYAECYLMLDFAWKPCLTDKMGRNIRQARRRKVVLA